MGVWYCRQRSTCARQYWQMYTGTYFCSGYAFRLMCNAWSLYLPTWCNCNILHGTFTSCLCQYVGYGKDLSTFYLPRTSIENIYLGASRWFLRDMYCRAWRASWRRFGLIWKQWRGQTCINPLCIRFQWNQPPCRLCVCAHLGRSLTQLAGRECSHCLQVVPTRICYVWWVRVVVSYKYKLIVGFLYLVYITYFAVLQWFALFQKYSDTIGEERT